MIAIHQLVHTLSYGDAISTEVLALQRVLRKLGAASEIFAINVHPRLKGKGRDYRDLPDSFSGGLILHYSLGSPLNQLYAAVRVETKALIYHNLTPAHWFSQVNPRIAADIEQGAKELPNLCQITNLLLADSRFNARELENLGFKAQVLELMIDPQRWQEPANAGITAMIKSQPGIHVVHVGRLAPNKCLEDVIKIFYFLHHHIARHSRLWLAGIDTDTELYSFGLKRLVQACRLDEAVNFVGCFADSEVRALYEQGSVYLGMSEHEGFCLPLAEAMHFGMPVAAFAAGAVPETLDGAGVLIYEKRHAEIAEVVARMAAPGPLRARLINGGYARAAELSYSRFSLRVRELFGSAGLIAAAA